MCKSLDQRGTRDHISAKDTMKDLKVNLLRFAQREQIKADIAAADEGLKKATTEDAAMIRNSRNKMQKQLNEGSPEPLTGKEKDTLFALEKKLLARITTNMPTEEVMRKNPPGAVDHAMRWEKANKPLIRMWKNVRVQLNQDNADRDLCNIDRYRPSGQTDRMRSDAQIPGLVSFGSVPDENWPFEAPANTALKQAERVAYSEEAAQFEVDAAIDSMTDEEITEVQEDTKSQMSPELHAVLVHRLQGAREAKKKKREEEAKLDAALQATE